MGGWTRASFLLSSIILTQSYRVTDPIIEYDPQKIAPNSFVSFYQEQPKPVEIQSFDNIAVQNFVQKPEIHPLFENIKIMPVKKVDIVQEAAKYGLETGDNSEYYSSSEDAAQDNAEGQSVAYSKPLRFSNDESGQGYSGEAPYRQDVSSYGLKSKKKGEIHYHQHKHLHEHEHSGDHVHKHSSGHVHEHNHGHNHDSAHKHQHSGKHDHSHKSEHQHAHQNHHQHDHKTWHGHEHKSSHKHGHSHGHKHEHEGQHKHEHKHNGEHSHDHHEQSKHGHDHDHKHEGHHIHDHHGDHKHSHSHKHHSEHSHGHHSSHGHFHHEPSNHHKVYIKKHY